MSVDMVRLQSLADEECENGIEACGETCRQPVDEDDNEDDADYPMQHWCGPCIAKTILGAKS